MSKSSLFQGMGGFTSLGQLSKIYTFFSPLVRYNHLSSITSIIRDASHVFGLTPQEVRYLKVNSKTHIHRICHFKVIVQSAVFKLHIVTSHKNQESRYIMTYNPIAGDSCFFIYIFDFSSLSNDKNSKTR